jgi:hypothetical protein
MVRTLYSALVWCLLTAGCVHGTPETSQPSPPPAAGTPETSQPSPPPVARTPETSPPNPPPVAGTPETSQPAPAPAPEPVAKAPAPKAKGNAAPPVTKAPAPSRGQAPGQVTPGAPVAPPRQTAVGPLDLSALKMRLKETKAIGVFTKLTLKNQVDDLMEKFRQHHAGKATPTLPELRRSYDLLLMKVLSLLQDDDQKLASDILSSRERIWDLLADPNKFAGLQA